MLKKKILAIILAVAMVTTLFSGCGENNTYIYFGDEMTKDTLRICVDSWRTDPTEGNRLEEAKVFFEDLAVKIKANCGIEKVTFELLPQSDSSRKMKLQRLRTEIMAGNGPDVFIVQTTFNSQLDSVGRLYEDAIFNYPEKSMEVGLFLPLDEYMENNSQFTDWDTQTQAVLNAGRSDEGQVIIPMTYTIPLLIYPKDEFDIPYTKNLTRRDILDNPETAELGAILYSLVNTSSAPFGLQDACNPIRDSLGEYADYENEELLFTEEELYAVTNEALQLEKTVLDNEWPFYEWAAVEAFALADSLRTGMEMKLVPRYGRDGGVTARITNFMAVNRGTKFPEKAFAVVDYLMQEDMQRTSMLFDLYFCDGFPLQNDLGTEEKSWNARRGTMDFLSAQHMDELLRIKEQITAVNFESGLDLIMQKMEYDLNFSKYNDPNGMTEVPRELVAKAYEDMARAMKE